MAYTYDRTASVKWDKVKTKRWMEQHVKDHVDRQTDEVNTTSLAEEAATEFDLYEDSKDYKIPEEVFDLAVDVGEAWEKKNKKSASYSYDRVATNLYGNPMLSYENRLGALQATFTGDVGKRAFEYIDTLHRRLSSKAPYSEISGFTSWDYGAAKDMDGGSWGIRVWQKDASQYPDKDLDPNIYINLDFKGDGRVSVFVEAGNKQLLSRTWGGTSSSSSASSIGMAVGEAWEKLLTGSVDYGD